MPSVTSGVVLGENEFGLTISKRELRLTGIPPFEADERVSRSAVRLPGKKSYDHFDNFANIKLCCSFLARNCGTCRHLNGSHSIADKKIFLLGDQNIPAMVGAGRDCVPVIRIEDASFEHLKHALNAQYLQGFIPAPGSVFAVSLLTHLCRVGNTDYWNQMEDFARWVSEHFNATVLPFLSPFSSKLPDGALIQIEKFIVTLKYKSVGEVGGEEDKKFMLWRPLEKVLKDFSVSRKNLPVHTVLIPGSTNKVVACENKGWEGLNADFSHGVPIEVERAFISALLSEICKNAPPSSRMTSPVDSSLELGYNGGVYFPHNDANFSALFLWGNSITSRVAPLLVHSAKDSGFKVSTLIKRSSFFSVKKIYAPKSSNEKSVLFVNCLSNDVFKFDDQIFANGSRHVVRPSFLSEKEIQQLVVNISNFLEKIAPKFNGKVKICGPFHRYLPVCCNDPAHQFIPIFPFENHVEYINILNKFLASHPALRIFSNVEFLPIQTVMGKFFPKGWLEDSVHLSQSGNNQLASFLKHVISRHANPSPVLTIQQASSFYKWAESHLPGRQPKKVQDRLGPRPSVQARLGSASNEQSNSTNNSSGFMEVDMSNSSSSNTSATTNQVNHSTPVGDRAPLLAAADKTGISPIEGEAAARAISRAIAEKIRPLPSGGSPVMIAEPDQSDNVVMQVSEPEFIPPGSLQDNDDLLDYEPEEDEAPPQPLHQLPLHDLQEEDDEDRELNEGMRAFDRLAGL